MKLSYLSLCALATAASAATTSAPPATVTFTATATITTTALSTVFITRIQSTPVPSPSTAKSSSKPAPTTLSTASRSSSAASPTASKSSNSAPLNPLVNAVRLFNVETYREGIPYLHQRQVQLTANNELVINADTGTSSGVIPFVGYLSSEQTLVPTRDNSTSASVAVYPNGALKVYLNSLITVPDVSEAPSSILANASAALVTVGGNAIAPWSITSKQFLALDSDSYAWSCPYGKSGVYYIFWSQDRPTGQYGCQRVDLYVPDSPVSTTLEKRTVMPEQTIPGVLIKRFWEFVARY